LPASAAAGVPVGEALAATGVSAPAAAMISRGRQVGALLGWTAGALVLLLLGTPAALAALLVGAGAFGWAGARAAESP
jgi:hypothetical protein